MTAKRFTINDCRVLSDEQVLRILNQLTDENEQLKESVYSWSKSYNRVYEEKEQLKHRLAISEKANYVTALEKENEQLKTFLESMKEELSLADRDNTILEKENEQLKTQLKDCEKRVTDKEVEWLRNNTVWEVMPSSHRTYTSTIYHRRNDE